jgi:hypothetical protein
LMDWGLNAQLHTCKVGSSATWAIPLVCFALDILELGSVDLFAQAGLKP